MTLLGQPHRRARHGHARAGGCAALGALTLALAAAPALAGSATPPRNYDGQLPAAKPPASASLEQCQTAATQAGRSATFAGEMTAVAGSQRMQMSVQLLERGPGDAGYHLVQGSGLGMWRSSTPGVQSYKYLRQVTNLAAPAFYRASIRFRWLGARGKTIQSLEMRTRRCEQPLLDEQSVS